MQATNNQTNRTGSGTEWLDSQSLADYLDTSRRTIEQWRICGGGPSYVKVGRLVRYRRADVDEWIESRVRRSTSDGGADR